MYFHSAQYDVSHSKNLKMDHFQWQKEAQAKRMGLWALRNPEEPWEWRKKQREGRL